MTDVKLLRQIIEEKGLSYTFVASKIGMSKQSLYAKLETGSDFKAWQMIEMQSLLNLTDEETKAIFYPKC